MAQMPGFGTRLVATISIADSALTFDVAEGKFAADVDIAGIFYDDKGKPIDSVVGRLRILRRDSDSATAPGSTTKQTRSIYRFSTLVPAGLYQVRIGVRDLKSGRTGSASDWITVRKI